MKIAVYSPTIYPVLDGTSVQAMRQVSLMSKDHEVLGISFKVDRNIKESERLGELRDGIVRIKPVYTRQGDFPSLSGEEVADRLNEFNPKIVHLRGWYQFQALREIIQKVVRKDRKIFWHADGLHECHTKFVKDIEYKQTVSLAISQGILFAGHTDHDWKILSSTGVNKRQYLQIPPILDERLQFSKKSWLNPVILSLARFFDYKRHIDVQVVSKKINKGLEVILAGPSDSKDSEKIIHDLIQEGATVVINPSEECCNLLYSLCSHFALASSKETLGIVTLEAVSAGCVPIARRNQGITTYLSEDYLFTTNEEFEEKMRRLLNPQEASKAQLELTGLRNKIKPQEIKKQFEIVYREEE